MAFEIIKNIVEAEQLSDNIKAEAIAEAEQIRAGAAAKSSEILADVKKQAKIQEDNLINKAVENSKGRCSEILAEAVKKCNNIKKTATERKSEAIEAVMGKVVG